MGLAAEAAGMVEDLVVMKELEEEVVIRIQRRLMLYMYKADVLVMVRL